MITRGGCDQIGRSFRKLKDLPPTLKCESVPCDKYVCGWCGLAGKRAFAGSRDQVVVHEAKCPHRRDNWNAAAKTYVSLRTESVISKAAPSSKALAQGIMSELKWAIKLTYQKHRLFEQEAKVQQKAAQGGLGGGRANLDAGGNPSQKISTGSSPAPKGSDEQRGGGEEPEADIQSKCGAGGLEHDVMAKAPSKQRHRL